MTCMTFLRMIALRIGSLIFFVVKRRGTEITNQFFDSHLKNQFQTSDFR